MKRVAVTGASGFLGRRLVQKLAVEADEVVCLLRTGSSAAQLDGPRIKVVRGDTDNPDFIQRAFVDVEAVFHCAAKVSDWGTLAGIRNANVTLCRSVVRAAELNAVERFVHVSTTDVYGHPGGTDVVEANPPPPAHFNWYAETKREAEAIVRQSNLQWTIFRPATIYGPGSVSMMAELAAALTSGFMLMVNRGRSVAGLVYVDDVADGMIQALSLPATVGQTFNLAAENTVSWQQLIDDLARICNSRYRTISLPFGPAHLLGHAMEALYRSGRRLTGWKCRPLLSRQAVQMMGVDQRFSIAAARRLCHYQPKTDYEAGMAETARWLHRRQG